MPSEYWPSENSVYFWYDSFSGCFLKPAHTRLLVERRTGGLITSQNTVSQHQPRTLFSSEYVLFSHYLFLFLQKLLIFAIVGFQIYLIANQITIKLLWIVVDRVFDHICLLTVYSDVIFLNESVSRWDVSLYFRHFHLFEGQVIC